MKRELRDLISKRNELNQEIELKKEIELNNQKLEEELEKKIEEGELRDLISKKELISQKN